MNLSELLLSTNSYGDLKEIAGQAADLLREIHWALDRREWDSDTPAQISELLENAGFTIRGPAVLTDFVVTYYEKGDDGMDNQLTYTCSARDADHAIEQCHDDYPGCTTTHVEEI